MLAMAFTLPTAHGENTVPRQDLDVLRKTAEQFLQTQSTGLPGDVKITVGAIDPRLKLPLCTMPEAFFPPSGKAWGRTTVGVRCSAPTTWTIYVSAEIRVFGQYVAAAAPLAQGQTIGLNDIAKVNGDLASLPSGVITDVSQAVGRTAANTIALGAPLRQDALRNQRAIQQGQGVRVIVNGPGFTVTSDAKALNNANEGQLTQVRTPNGQLISGIAKLGGVVELAY